MTDSKHEETATTEGMPEVVVEHDPPPPVDNDHVAPGAQFFDPLPSYVLHLHERMRTMEEALQGLMSHQQSAHPAVITWLQKMEARAVAFKDHLVRFSSQSTPPAETVITPPSAPSAEEQAGSSSSKTSS